jgi:hypothetical protein|tara:strand:- start:1183 stop:1476 length:294 start_codon:yes stop_codon:yes gene_type:complete
MAAGLPIDTLTENRKAGKPLVRDLDGFPCVVITRFDPQNGKPLPPNPVPVDLPGAKNLLAKQEELVNTQKANLDDQLATLRQLVKELGDHPANAGKE